METGRKKTIRAAFLISGLTFLSYLLGIFKLRVLGSAFGASLELDSLNAAFILPEFALNLFVAGALSATFIPVFSDYIHQEKEAEGFKLANSILNLVVLVTTLIALVGILGAGFWVNLVVPGFSQEGKILTANLLRILFITPLIFGLSNALGDILVAYQRFFAFALAPLLYNLGIILGVVFFKNNLGIYSAALGAVLGALLHFSVRFIESFKTPFRYQIFLNLRLAGLRRIFKLMIPKAVTMSVVQLNLWIDTIAASLILAVGSITVFRFSLPIERLPVSLFGIAFATAVFPVLTKAATQKDWSLYQENFLASFKEILFFALPVSVGMFLLRNQIALFLLGAGKYDANAVGLTAATLGMLSLSITFESLINLLWRGFYALKNTITPMKISLMGLALNAALVFPLAFALGVKGIGLTFSFVSIFQVALLMIFLRKKVALSLSSLTLPLIKIFIASSAMAFGVYEFLGFHLKLLPQILGALIVGAGIYFLVSLVLNIEEVKILKKIFR